MKWALRPPSRRRIKVREAAASLALFKPVHNGSDLCHHRAPVVGNHDCLGEISRHPGCKRPSTCRQFSRRLARHTTQALHPILMDTSEEEVRWTGNDVITRYIPFVVVPVNG